MKRINNFGEKTVREAREFLASLSTHDRVRFLECLMCEHNDYCNTDNIEEDAQGFCKVFKGESNYDVT